MIEHGRAGLSLVCWLYLAALGWLVLWVVLPAVLLGWRPVLADVDLAASVQRGDVIMVSGAPVAGIRELPPVAQGSRLLVPLIGRPLVWWRGGELLPLVLWSAITVGAVTVLVRLRPLQGPQATMERDWSSPVVSGLLRRDAAVSTTWSPRPSPLAASAPRQPGEAIAAAAGGGLRALPSTTGGPATRGAPTRPRPGRQLDGSTPSPQRPWSVPLEAGRATAGTRGTDAA